MSEGLSNLPLVPNSSILAMTFICIDGTAPVGGEFLCRQATATTDKPIGISQVAYDFPPGLGTIANPSSPPTQYAGVAGEPIQIFFGGDVCNLLIGAGGCTAGDLLGPDSSGKGIVVTSGLYGAIAVDTCAAGELATVITMFGKV